MDLPATFHPAVRAWFEETFAAASDAQSRGWHEILAGRDTLVAAPTGSGKTLAAFLASIDRLTQLATENALPDEIRVLYVSPLRALSSDVEKNLLGPLAAIHQKALAMGYSSKPIRTALRTGDSSASSRAAILRTPPHILITTPESLYLMLTARRARELLASVDTVIIDELHALMRDKRGSHLALSLARLDAVAQKPQRIGLSATIHPIEDAGRFLCGVGRQASIVDVGHRRALDLSVQVPSTDLGAVATHEQWAEIYAQLASLIERHRTTLVFVNTRKQAERVAHHLGEKLGDGQVSAHHGSLSKDRRLAIEARLKAGDMRAIVATASLELGIDVGAVDLVCQVGSPRAMTTLLQRIGRSGHGLGRTSRGVLFPTSRDDLAECAALVRGIRAGKLDRVEPPSMPTDVLAQQLVAECAAKDWSLDELYALVRTATPYADLPREVFDEIVTMLGEGPAKRIGRSGALLHVDRVHGAVKGRRAARIVALTNGGAIPDLADYRVLLDPDDTFLGTVNEDWAIESMAGDVFVLGSHNWRISRVESKRGVLRVVDAAGASPTVPFWLGEAPARTWEHSAEVSGLRSALVELLDAGGDPVAWLVAECALSPSAAEQLAAYVRAQRDALGVIPTQTDIVFERFFDESGGMQLVVHAPFGGRVNRAFGLALRKRFCMCFDFELQAAASDDAIVLSLSNAHSFPLEDAFHFVRSHELEETLRKAVLAAPMFEARWRWNATRSLSVLRREGGKKVQPYLQRMRSDDLLAAVFPAQIACQENATGPIEIPDHPLVNQTIRDCLLEAMDAPRLAGLLAQMERGEVRMHARDTTEPSPFTHEILNSRPYTFLDDAPLEERKARALAVRRVLPESQRDLGALDPEAIGRVVAEVRPAPRDPDELHDLLLSAVVLPIDPSWAAYFEALVATGRALAIETPAGWLAAATESHARLQAIYPGAARRPDVRFGGDEVSREDAVYALVRSFAEIAGPFTEGEVADRAGIDVLDARIATARLESEGFLLRGSFRTGRRDELCDRRLLQRIHRYTLDRLRREIEPVSAQDFLRYLLERHHLTKGARTGGRLALREAIGLLQGFEVAAAAWEDDVLARRVAGYRSEWLDELCWAGEVAWARLSPKQPTAAGGGPSRATPVALTMRADLDWLLEAVRGTEVSEAPASVAATAVKDVLRRKGALFAHDLLVHTRLSKPELTTALWELIARGLATSDGFQPLRELIGGARSKKRVSRAPQGRFALVEPRPADPAVQEPADRVAGQLLARYGVVFRDLVVRESFVTPWRDVVRALRTREARGLVRGGRFVSGFIGEQFALPDAVDALRRVRRTPHTGEVVTVSAADPLNLVGILLPGDRVPAVASNRVTYRDGAFDPSAEDGGVLRIA